MSTLKEFPSCRPRCFFFSIELQPDSKQKQLPNDVCFMFFFVCVIAATHDNVSRLLANVYEATQFDSKFFALNVRKENKTLSFQCCNVNVEFQERGRALKHFSKRCNEKKNKKTK